MESFHQRVTSCDQSVPREVYVWQALPHITHTSKNSYFGEPVPRTGRLNGNTRRWGDIALAGQAEIIDKLLTESKAQGLNEKETAFFLATARLESGFNPDAASQLSSASGLGQFIDATARAYGLTEKRFSLTANIKAMIRYLGEGIEFAKRVTSAKNPDLCYAYAYYHDGPTLKYGGYQICREKLIPTYQLIKTWLASCSQSK